MIAAPFYGEFGWEVALWAPHLRWMREHVFPQLKVMCRYGHKALYEDFADEIVPCEPPPLSRIDCQNAWLAGGGVFDAAAWASAIDNKKQVNKKGVYTPAEMQLRWDPVPTTDRLIHKQLRHGSPQRGWIAVHARACPSNRHVTGLLAANGVAFTCPAVDPT